ncbi:hypothetical protein AWB71_02776 [Caballeronia peredens]|nr:hypothetical protein AWB71_02776 [Caballeronia peredens]
MAITFVISQSQRYLDVLARIAGRRFRQFVGGSK